ncbi:CRAL-TRIO domain-containing protein [Sporobolomyces koalae]|uniref:CRAL-TRIO domain-containing protein n=1 Tax=Sporobolomyces koalae TaxID=500713 RepID=UPI003174E5AD
MSSFEATLPQPPASSETPFSYPVAQPAASSTPLAPRVVTPEQQEKIDRLIAHFNDPEFKLPTTLKELKQLWVSQGKEQGSRFGSLFGGTSTKPQPLDASALHKLDEVEKCYWSSQAFQRCLRATKWDYANAVKRAEETCVWRREFRVEQMQEADVTREGETGKELVFGFDNDCRPVLYMHPYRQNTQTGPDQIAFVVWCLERALDLAPATDPATEMLCLCIDFGANLKDSKSQPTTLSQARKVLEILQTYYCERLGKAICVNIPPIFFTFYKLVSPFVDPVTKEKIRFIEGTADATSLIPAEQLQRIFGGSVNFEYDHSTYFPALTKLCFERKALHLERWKRFGGGLCGVDEAIIRGGKEPSGSSSSRTEEPSEVTTNQAETATQEEEQVPTRQLEQVQLAKDESPEGTVVDTNEPTPGIATSEGGGGDKFVDAPVATKDQINQAVPALSA